MKEKQVRTTKKAIRCAAAALALAAAIPLLFVPSGAAGLGSGACVVASEVTMIRSTLKGKTIRFTETDFKCALGVANFDKVTITALPSSADGVLMYDGRRVREGQSIRRRSIDALSFVPASNETEEASFRFTVGRGTGAEILCLLRFPDTVHYAPKTDAGSNGATKTQKNIGCYGKLTATDPDGDAIEFILVSAPENGRLSLSKESGDYLYVPDRGYTGEDRFIYVVRDEYGNYTTPCRVDVTVTERMSEVEYVDMESAPEYNAAVAMTALNVMAGRLIGDDMYFDPDGSVTRAEFIAMAMKARGIRPDSTLQKTYFDDNDDIPASLVGYMATAQKIGIARGVFEGGKLLLEPNRAITRYEAAVVLADLTLQQGEAELTVFAVETEVPLYARASVYSMLASGVFSSTEDLTGAITRADAARYLYKII